MDAKLFPVYVMGHDLCDERVVKGGFRYTLPSCGYSVRSSSAFSPPVATGDSQRGMVGFSISGVVCSSSPVAVL
jgi:hypothetical protein